MLQKLHKLKKILLLRDTGATQDVHAIRPGVEMVTWNTDPGLIYNQPTVCDGLPALNIHDEDTIKSADWLTEEKGAYWLNSTEPMKPEKQPGEIWYRSCDCWLAVEWCICHE